MMTFAPESVSVALGSGAAFGATRAGATNAGFGGSC